MDHRDIENYKHLKETARNLSQVGCFCTKKYSTSAKSPRLKKKLFIENMFFNTGKPGCLPAPGSSLVSRNCQWAFSNIFWCKHPQRCTCAKRKLPRPSRFWYRAGPPSNNFSLLSWHILSVDSFVAGLPGHPTEHLMLNTLIECCYPVIWGLGAQG